MVTNDPLTDIRQALEHVRAHKHPELGRGEDIYCLNLTAWMGERMGFVLRHYDQRVAQLIKEVDQTERTLEQQNRVVEAARAIVAELKRLGQYGPDDPAGVPTDRIRSDRWPFEVALVAAVDILDKDVEK